MEKQDIRIHKQAVDRFVKAVKDVLADEVFGPKAKWMLAGLILLLLGSNGMNVVNNYVGRDFMTAIENRHHGDFVRLAFVYLLVFAASTIILVIAKYLEDSLGLHWREFISRRSIARYLLKGNYYRLDSSGELRNPDQRIAEDVRAFTVTTLSFVVVILNGVITILAFSGVVWSISPLLFLVAVVYAACGSWATFSLGRPLIDLNYNQLDKEADLRSTLIHVRQNAESILLAHREGRLAKRLLFRLNRVVKNLRGIINVNRNLGFFTGGYYWLIGLIPVVIVAPDFMAGKIAFGVVTQSAMAFSTLVGAFSLVVTQFQSISNFTAVCERLYSLIQAIEAIEKAEEKKKEGQGDVVVVDRIAYKEVNLASQEPGKFLLQEDLSITIPYASKVLITGPNMAAAVALFKATAGLEAGVKGHIIRPSIGEILFLAERPYLPPGTLRHILSPTFMEKNGPDKRFQSFLEELEPKSVRDRVPNIEEGALEELLKEMELDSLKERAGGLDVEQDWDDFLSLAEQQLLAFIHVLLRKPKMVFLDRPGTALNFEQVQMVLKKLNEEAIGYIKIGQDNEPLDTYDWVLEIEEDGAWNWNPPKA